MASKSADIRPGITLACTECKERNYITTKNRRNTPDRLELKKFCPRCGKPLKIDPQTQRAASSNALSREVSGLYICDDCGSDEALRAFAGLPLPLEEWEQTSLINSMYK